jgi:hypothetical protein
LAADSKNDWSDEALGGLYELRAGQARRLAERLPFVVSMSNPDSHVLMDRGELWQKFCALKEEQALRHAIFPGLAGKAKRTL